MLGKDLKIFINHEEVKADAAVYNHISDVLFIGEQKLRIVDTENLYHSVLSVETFGGKILRIAKYDTDKEISEIYLNIEEEELVGVYVKFADSEYAWILFEFDYSIHTMWETDILWENKK